MVGDLRLFGLRRLRVFDAHLLDHVARAENGVEGAGLLQNQERERGGTVTASSESILRFRRMPAFASLSITCR